MKQLNSDQPKIYSPKRLVWVSSFEQGAFLCNQQLPLYCRWQVSGIA
jgi:hypothetical protein